MLALALAALLAAPQALPGSAPNLLQNGDFELKASRTAPLPGWQLIDAFEGPGEGQPTSIEMTREDAHAGRAGLSLAATERTERGVHAMQAVEARPGGRYALEVWLAAREPCEGDPRVTLFMLDGAGVRLAEAHARPAQEGGWSAQTLALEAPPDTRHVRVELLPPTRGVFSLDDLHLGLEAGTPLPAPDVVFEEGFEQGKELPRHFSARLALRSGVGSNESKIDLERRKGANGSRQSLTLEGRRDTVLWNEVGRVFPVEVGDALILTGFVRADDVTPREGLAASFSARLEFLDPRGGVIGGALSVSPGRGSFDWRPVEVLAIAPERATQVLIAMNLSMEGQVWWDDLRLERWPAIAAPYDGWYSREEGSIVVEYHKEHAARLEMNGIAKGMDEALTRVREALGSASATQFTAYLYRDEGEALGLTGSAAAHADGPGARLHIGADLAYGLPLTELALFDALGAVRNEVFRVGPTHWFAFDAAPEPTSPAARHAAAAAKLDAKDLAPLEKWIDDGADLDADAALSLCGWLVATQGLEALSALRQASDPAAALASLFDGSLEAADEAWRGFLANL